MKTKSVNHHAYIEYLPSNQRDIWGVKTSKGNGFHPQGADNVTGKRTHTGKKRLNHIGHFCD